MTPALIVTEDCPECGERLTLRRNRREGSLFVGCSAYPDCEFTEPHDAREQRLAERIAELEDSMLAVPSSPVEVLAKELKLLARRFHPDRHGGERWAHEVCSALLELRERIAGRRAA